MPHKYFVGLFSFTLEYPLFNEFYKLFADLAQNSGYNSAYVGVAVVKNMPPIDGLDNLSLLEKLGLPVYLHYNINYKDESPGEMSFDVLDERHVTYHHSTVWPDDLIYVYIYGFARAFLSNEYQFTVLYDVIALRQDMGGGETIIHLTWEPR